MKILLTGGSGRLGTELQKLRKFDYVPTHAEMDIASRTSVRNYFKEKEIDLIIHCAAYTNVIEAETNNLECFKANVVGIHLLTKSAPTLYTSTEYAQFPHLNYYSYTKREAEEYATKTLRLLFKPRPWPYDSAFDDQFTSGDYVDVIAAEVNKAIDLYEYLPRLTNIGTGRKSMYDLAKQTKPDVKSNSVKDYIKETGVKIPLDSSMDCSEWEKIKEKHV